MLSKSVRSWSKDWAERLRPSKLHLTFFVTGLLLTSSAWATLTVAPVKRDGTALANTDGFIGYYPVSGTGLDSGDPAVPALVSAADTQSSDGTGDKALLFNLTGASSYTAPTTGSFGLYVMAFVTSTTGSDQYPVPISWYNQNASSSGAFQSCLNNCNLLISNVNGRDYYFAAPFVAGQTMQVGIYPSDICNAQNAQLSSGTAPPCSGNAFLAPDGTTVLTTAFHLKFYVVYVPSSPTFSLNTTQSILSSTFQFPDTANYTLSFQTKGGTETCPGVQAANVYFPGDQRIYLDTTRFTFTQFTGTGSGTPAPAGQLVITATTSSSLNGSPTPDNSIGGFQNNLFGRVPLGNTSQEVGGFQNSSDAQSTYYQLGFLIRDLAGYVTTNSNTDACKVINVRTADIQGFLKESKCFIATAAFQSGRAAPVMLLRHFRDQVLLKFGLGESFVHWYYRWSPPAAEWLIEHPGFRYPVLLALAPLEILAWLCLRPVILLFLFGATLALFAVIRRREVA